MKEQWFSFALQLVDELSKTENDKVKIHILMNALQKAYDIGKAQSSGTQ